MNDVAWRDVTVLEADQLLHDAVLDSASFQLEGVRFSASGYAEDVYQGWTARFRLEFWIEQVSAWKLEDRAQIEQFYVDSVELAPGEIRFLSPLPMTLAVSTESTGIRYRRDSTPYARRRWWRWQSFTS